MELILHAGWGKTGTTSIQSHFAKQRAHNLTNFRLLYPQTGASNNLNGEDAHHIFSLAFQDIGGMSTGLSLSALLRNLKNEIQQNPCDKVLISSEIMPIVFESEEFRDFIKLNEIRVSLVLTIRRLSEVLMSTTSQIIRDTATDFPATPFAVFLSNRRNFNYFSKIRTWESSGTLGEIRLIPYSSSVVSDFTELVTGAPMDASARSRIEWHNPSVPVARIAALQRIKQALFAESTYTAERFAQITSRLIELPEKHFIEEISWLSATEQQLVDEFFEEENAQLLARFPHIATALQSTDYRDIRSFSQLDAEGLQFTISG